MAKSGGGGGSGFGFGLRRGHTGRRKLNLGFTFLKCQSGQLKEHTGPGNNMEIRAFTDLVNFQQIFVIYLMPF